MPSPSPTCSKALRKQEPIPIPLPLLGNTNPISNASPKSRTRKIPPPVDDGGAGNGGGGGGAIGWSESEAGDPSASEPEKEDKDKKKNTYSSSAIWVIVKPGVNLEITSLEAISTYLTETKENTPGAYTFKRKDDQSDPPTTKIKLKVHQTGTEGATRKLKWDAKKLVLVGQEGGDGTLELSESDGDKVYELYGHKDLGKDDAQTITLTATASTGFLGTDTVVVNLLSVEVKEVKFEKGEGTYMSLNSDSNTPYPETQWKDNNGDANASDDGECNYAVAYVCKSKPKMGATFKLKKASNFSNIKIKATGPDGIEIPSTTPTISGDEVTLDPKESSGALPDTIKYYDKKERNGFTAFKLDWQISVDGGANWSKINSSKHTVYVTLGEPKTTLRQETLFYIGCKNAHGVKDESTARTKAYSEFTDRKVFRVGETENPMRYWGDWRANNIPPYTTAGLLSSADRNGNCQAWSGLFRDILLVQGIEAHRMKVFSKTSNEGVAVNKWTFTDSGHGTPLYPYLINIDTKASPAKGQGNDDTPPYFNGHWITLSGDAYYDPSYGTSPVWGANKDKKYEDSAFAGYTDNRDMPSAARKNLIIETSDSETTYTNDDAY